MLSDNGEALSEHGAMGDRFAVVRDFDATTGLHHLRPNNRRFRRRASRCGGGTESQVRSRLVTTSATSGKLTKSAARFASRIEITFDDTGLPRLKDLSE